MTGWRACIEVAVEDEYGVLPDGGYAESDWHYLGPGGTFTFTGNNNWKYQNGIGNKKPELQLEGRFSSTWNGSVYLDYNNFYWLYMCFEGYSFNSSTGEHAFGFLNDTPVRSYAMRVTRLDSVVGGQDTMQTILTGCKVNSFGWSYENSSGGLKCDFSGLCNNWYPTMQDISELPIYTNQSKNDADAVNWGCFRIKEGNTYVTVANNERASWKAGRTVSTVPNSCGRIDKASYESALQPITLSSQVYSRDVDGWMSRFRNGGNVGGTNNLPYISDLPNNWAGTGSNAPVGMPERGLEPIPDVLICSFEGDKSNPTQYIKVFFANVGVESWGNTYNTGSEITENPSMKAMDMAVIIKSTLVNSAIDAEVTGNVSGPGEEQLQH